MSRQYTFQKDTCDISFMELTGKKNQEKAGFKEE